MGIVCHCPNGHRVKVKDHQAGKRGLCPTCGSKFSIPATTGSCRSIRPSLRRCRGPCHLGRRVPLPKLLPPKPQLLPRHTSRWNLTRRRYHWERIPWLTK